MPRIESIVIHQGPQGAKGDPSLTVGPNTLALGAGQYPAGNGTTVVASTFATDVAATAAVTANTAAVGRVDPGTAGASGQYLTVGPSRTAWLTEPVFNVRHPRFGAVGNGTTDDTTAVQAAITAAQAVTGGATVLFPAGTYRVTGVTVSAAAITFRGVGRSASILLSTSGDVVTLTGATKFVCMHMQVHSAAGGGHCFTVSDSISHGLWFDVTAQQDNTGKSVLQADDANAGTLNYIDNLWLHCDTQHGGSATVPTFNLRGGAINRNRWSDMRVSYSGNYTWLIETTAAASYANNNTIEGITGEILNGGVVWLRGALVTTLKDIGLYDFGTITKSLINIDASSVTSTLRTSGVTCINVTRVGGTIGSFYDCVVSVSSGGNTFIGCGTSATPFAINLGSQRATLMGGAYTITNGASANIFSGPGAVTTLSDPVQLGNYLRLKAYTTAARPAAATAGAGGVYYDTTLSKPGYSDGTTWRDATGTAI